jgi:N-carbamoylputrescine amidase
MIEKANLRVAAAQIETRLGDVPGNLRKHLEWIARARAASVDVLVFPELSLTGYSLRERAAGAALTGSATPMLEIARAAGGMAVTIGLVERADTGLFNSAVTIGDGRVLHVHRKVNLPGYGRLDENRWFAAGAHIDTFALRSGWTAASLICADLWNPALVHIAACRGADLLLAPVSSAREAVDGFDNPKGWETTLNFYAMMYGLPTVMANRIGDEGDLTFWGGSRIVDSSGRTLARSGDGEELVIADLARQDIVAARAGLPTVRDSNPALVHAELGRWLDLNETRWHAKVNGR